MVGLLQLAGRLGHWGVLGGSGSGLVSGILARQTVQFTPSAPSREAPTASKPGAMPTLAVGMLAVSLALA